VTIAPANPTDSEGEKRADRRGKRHEQHSVVERTDAVRMQAQAEELLKAVEHRRVVRLQRRVEG
jgi:hypothetical protein